MNESANEFWLEARVDAADTDADVLEDWLFAAGALSVTVKDAVGDDELEHAVLEPLPGEVRLWTSVSLVGLFDKGSSEQATAVALKQSAADAGMPCPEFQIGRLRDQVWERTWMESFKPMRFGHQLWICPTAIEPPDATAINIRLDPGMAFGTGTHATTAQCLEWLGEQTMSDLQPLKDKLVIDYGCGSGVLGIAALLLGAKHVWAVDIDEQALLATRENAITNNVQGRLSIGQPELIQGVSADIVLANILFKPLMDLVDTISAATSHGGALILSGILENQIEPLRMRYTHAFDFTAARASDGWALMSATRR